MAERGSSRAWEEEDDEDSSDEEENGCNTVEKYNCGSDTCRIRRKWKWFWVVFGVLSAAGLFFAIIVGIMLYVSYGDDSGNVATGA